MPDASPTPHAIPLPYGQPVVIPLGIVGDMIRRLLELQATLLLASSGSITFHFGTPHTGDHSPRVTTKSELTYK